MAPSRGPDSAIVEAITNLALAKIGAGTRSPMLLGLCGAQGTGKSTLAAALAASFERRETSAVVVSIDDLYKEKRDRERMARDVHPLFRTRGVPGTHDLGLAMSALDALAAGHDAVVPRFDKRVDDRCPPQQWTTIAADTRIIIFEGWCVGARPLEDQPDAPINALERTEDADGRWRRAVADALRGEYQTLFERLDLLVLLAAPSFDVVLNWRIEQEQDLRASGGGGMTDAELGRFVQHYERLTRHILETMPSYADLTIFLDAHRAVQAIRPR